MRCSARCTHLGRVVDVPPWSKKMEIKGTYLGRVAGAKMAEGWYASSFFSAKEIFEQLRRFLSEKSKQNEA